MATNVVHSNEPREQEHTSTLVLASAIFYFLTSFLLYFYSYFNFLICMGSFLIYIIISTILWLLYRKFWRFWTVLTVLDNIFITIAVFQQLFYISNFLIAYFVSQTISKIALK